MFTIDQCPPEVQSLKKHADELSAKINNSVLAVPGWIVITRNVALGCVSNWTNPPIRRGRYAPPPPISDAKRADFNVLDAMRWIK